MREDQSFYTRQLNLKCDICDNEEIITTSWPEKRPSAFTSDYKGWCGVESDLFLMPQALGLDVHDVCPDCANAVSMAIETAVEERKDWASYNALSNPDSIPDSGDTN